MGQSDPKTAQAASREAGRHYGKFRGFVTNNDDPESLGRIRAKVPEVLHDVETGWALPCTPYSGDATGLWAVPEPGAGVWIEFEAGDVSRPIWTGCWWIRDKAPRDESGASVRPQTRLLRSEQGLMLALHDRDKQVALSDADGRNILRIEVDAGKVSVRAVTKVIVEAPAIELVESASHPLVFGDLLMAYINQLVTLFNTHTHPGQLAGGVMPVSPMPPVASFTPFQSSLLSTKVRTG